MPQIAWNAVRQVDRRQLFSEVLNAVTWKALFAVGAHMWNTKPDGWGRQGVVRERLKVNLR